jgi:hypothetical protein
VEKEEQKKVWKEKSNRYWVQQQEAHRSVEVGLWEKKPSQEAYMWKGDQEDRVGILVPSTYFWFLTDPWWVEGLELPCTELAG